MTSGPETSPEAEGRTEAVCAVCAHPWSAHDVVAARYCAATMAGGHDRGCVCSGVSGGMAYNKSSKEPG
ncbi:RGCVC family protein [Amycolatopsis anabasis]|uniref:RGCVC family protein n=1 Tax=Amycolatopsis anabasis TaxID=1840409 RepID=UPI00131D0FAC|nr:RGCVC family protein [Amycolatopsis anabasis]